MTRRRDARRLAVSILFQADVSERDPLEVLDERRGVGERLPGFTTDLVEGIASTMAEVDRVIEEHLDHWSLARLAAVDRAILRVACFELLHREETPDAVAIDEAVAAAKELSTEESGAFVNGVLGRISRERAGAG